MKKISVVIPVYNVEKYLDRCVASLINQPYKNLEIILVDDGSPDNCPAMCDEWAKKDSRIKAVHKINGGVSSARNVGIDVSTGDYITFVDSDDYVNDAFSQVIEEVISNDMQIAFVPLEKLDCSKEIVLNDSNFHQILKDNSIAISSTWSKLFKRDLLEQNKFLEGVTVAEDTEFIARLLTKCEKINI